VIGMGCPRVFRSKTAARRFNAVFGVQNFIRLVHRNSNGRDDLVAMTERQHAKDTKNIAILTLGLSSAGILLGAAVAAAYFGAIAMTSHAGTEWVFTSTSMDFMAHDQKHYFEYLRRNDGRTTSSTNAEILIQSTPAGVSIPLDVILDTLKEEKDEDEPHDEIINLLKKPEPTIEELKRVFTRRVHPVTAFIRPFFVGFGSWVLAGLIGAPWWMARGIVGLSQYVHQRCWWGEYCCNSSLKHSVVIYGAYCLLRIFVIKTPISDVNGWISDVVDAAVGAWAFSGSLQSIPAAYLRC